MNNTIVIIQARTSSQRLPAKVMLPIKGMPIAILAAKRASNTGKKTIVTTSIEASDDGLVSLLDRYDVESSRGSLDDVLGRIVHTLSEYEDDTIVFRLTADNVFPDGYLLDEMEAEFLNKKISYMICNGIDCGVPYGMSAEVTRLSLLREANRNSVSKFDREHVMPYIVRKYGTYFFKKYKSINKGHFRCTIDCFDDFINIQRVFETVLDPIKVSSIELIKLLENTPMQPLSSKLTSKLVLGTAQLGGAYGINNSFGQPSHKAGKEIIKEAVSNGVIYLDTANSYGESEHVIGNFLKDGWSERVKVITKLSNINPNDLIESNKHVEKFVDASIYQSCSRLGTNVLDVLMLHRADHITKWKGAVLERLLELKSNGVINKLGVSVQSPSELEQVLGNSDIEFIQLPFNLLDWRWEKLVLPILAEKKKRNLNIHIRSVFLQGLLLSKSEKHWKHAHVNGSYEIRAWIEDQVKVNQRAGILDLCLSYVNSHDWIDGVVLGMETKKQLVENINFFNSTSLSSEQVKAIHSSRPRLEFKSLDPSSWGG